jgi:hypothetical protein
MRFDAGDFHGAIPNFCRKTAKTRFSFTKTQGGWIAALVPGASGPVK